MKELQQLEAAILNQATFGSSPDPNVISNAEAAYRCNDASLILHYAGILDTFNGSGDTVAAPSGFVQGKATPQLAKHKAVKAYWDTKV